VAAMHRLNERNVWTSPRMARQLSGDGTSTTGSSSACRMSVGTGDAIEDAGRGGAIVVVVGHRRSRSSAR